MNMLVTFEEIKKVQKMKFELIAINTNADMLNDGIERMEKETLKSFLAADAKVYGVWAKQMKESAEKIMQYIEELEKV